MMIRSRVFRKHYLITALVLFIFIFLGFLTNLLIVRLSTRLDANRPMLFARLFDYIDPAHRDKVMFDVVNMREAPPSYQMGIVAADGTLVAPAGMKLGFEWNSVIPPSEPYKYITIGKQYELIKFAGEPVQYLYVDSSSLKPTKTKLKEIVASVGILLLTVLLGVGFALFILFRSIQEQVTLADTVIDELQRGNLKARFPIRKHDEFRHAMTRFNHMADEIERLVEQLKSVEKSRMGLLQELAHDLRTPVASLKTLLETVHTKQASIQPIVQTELMTLALKEVDYFERLVEDLLILAQVTEPRYHADRAPISLRAILEEEAESISVKYSRVKKIKLVKDFKSDPDSSLEIHGDPLLLKRMFRNALDNAYSFAIETVVLQGSVQGSTVRIQVQDDGPGLSTEALNSFGTRQLTRFLGTNKEGRLSVGLGSVIMRTVAELHRGTVEAQNRTDSSGKVLGAEIQFAFPSADAIS